jgi:hypothetical protein
LAICGSYKCRYIFSCSVLIFTAVVSLVQITRYSCLKFQYIGIDKVSHYKNKEAFKWCSLWRIVFEPGFSSMSQCFIIAVVS